MEENFKVYAGQILIDEVSTKEEAEEITEFFTRTWPLYGGAKYWFQEVKK